MQVESMLLFTRLLTVKFKDYIINTTIYTEQTEMKININPTAGFYEVKFSK